MDDDFGLWDVFVSTFWFMLLFAWIMLLFRIIGDIFRDDELSGGMKAFWTLFIILLPWLGVLVYLIARGGSMAGRSIKEAQAADARTPAYIQKAAGSGGGGHVSARPPGLAGLGGAGADTPPEDEQAQA